MGEWSEYFEDFPEENPANWINGVFDPVTARQSRILAAKQKEANAEVLALIEEATKKQKEKLAAKQKELKLKSLLNVQDCPQCGLNELNMYCFGDKLFRCECQDCGIYGGGTSEEEAYQTAYDALGEGLDWRERQ
ncbi:TPA: hypothetical protein RQK83_004466 [Vibrio vulnificus]|nr:hypothetical protein [Vibrio vulnificus]HDY8057928.1 hypothetical protein [Vibrio vulnificus]